MPYRLLSCLLLSILALSACQDYDFRVNDTVVYTPAPLFRDYQVPDPALRACLQQAIADGEVRAAPQLTQLDCSSAGIESLEGLATFAGLTALRLSSNRIRNLVELGSLPALEELHLDGNKVVDPVPLYKLPALALLDLAGNPQLQCPRSGSLDRVRKVTLPAHCR